MMTSLRPGPPDPYRDPSLPVGQRVADLMSRMTLDEKLAQLGSVWVLSLLDGERFSRDRAATALAHGIGHVTRPAGATTMGSAAVAAAVNDIQRHLVTRTRLGIPAVMHEESLHGYLAAESVVYPQAVGMAATWDPALIEQASAAIGAHLRALGATQTLSPVLDLGLDPRWGRVEETLGEDPFLVAEIAAAAIRGLQSRGVVATAKHLAGHGAPEGGRNRGPVHLGRRELLDDHLYPFEVAVRREAVGAVMHAYNDLDGLPCVANEWLLTQCLRGAWGFDGVVVSDYNGIEELVTSHAMVAGFAEAAATALRAGVDVELPATATYGEPLREAMASGWVGEQEVDRAVGRVLAMKIRAGLLEDPYVPEPESVSIDLDSQRSLARRVAVESMVLLSNPAGVLPFTAAGSVAVLGPLADSYRDLLGGYSHVPHIQLLVEMRDDTNVFDFPVPDDLTLSPDALDGPTVLDEIRRAFPASQVTYAAGCGLSDDDASGVPAAVDLARHSDLAVLVLGDRSGLTDDCTTGEARDRLTLGLPGRQRELLRDVVATGTPTVVVTISGRPPTLPETVLDTAACVHAWVPGETGARAIVDVLTGAAEPGGRLPMTVLREAGQIPLTYRHRPSGGRSHWKGDYVDGAAAPLLPFGHGLTYTDFALDDLALAGDDVATDGVVTLTCRLSNVGRRAGTAVVQLYARDHEASVTRPIRELVSFARVPLAADAAAVLTFRVPAPFLSFTDREMVRVVEPGRHTFWVGLSASDLRDECHVTLTGPRRAVPDRPGHTPVARWHVATSDGVSG